MVGENEEKGLVTIEEVAEPKDVAEFGKKAADVLKDIVEDSKSYTVINGNKHLHFEAWQTIAKFYGATVGVEWTKPIMLDDKIFGYEAKANVLDKNGKIISSAESSCSREENTWKNRADFQVRSMSQTRACAKALRNVYAWVVVLAKYKPTPAEELDDDKPMTKAEAEAYKQAKNGKGQVIDITQEEIPPQRPKDPVCVAPDCGKKITDKVYDYSMSNYGMSLCYDHQTYFKKTGGLE